MTEQGLKRVKIARIVVFFVLLAYVLFFIIINASTFSADNVSRFFFNVRSALGGNIAKDQEIDFEESNKNTISMFKDGLVILNQKKLSVYSRDNIEMQSVTVNFTNPTLKKSNNYIVTFDRTGTVLNLHDSFNVIAQKVFNEKIINATVNDSGYVAVVTATFGYKAKVTVLNSKLEDLYYWYSSKTNVIDVVFSTNNIISVVGIVSELGSIDTKIHRINFRTGEEQIVYTIDDSFPLGIVMKTDNSTEILTDNGLYNLSADGVRKLFNYDASSIESFYQDVRHSVFVRVSDIAQNMFQVDAVSSTGAYLFSKEYPDVRSVSCSYDLFYILSENYIYMLDNEGNELRKIEILYSANSVVCNQDIVFVLGSNYALKTNISE